MYVKLSMVVKSHYDGITWSLREHLTVKNLASCEARIAYLFHNFQTTKLPIWILVSLLWNEKFCQQNPSFVT